MATTSPDNLFSPDGPNAYNLTVDLAAMQSSVQTALNGFKVRGGTTTQRNAYTATAGDYWSDTTTGYLYKWSGSVWLIAPGQVLAQGTVTTNITGAVGTNVIPAISTPTLPIGQSFKVMSSFGQYNTGVGNSVVRMNWRNNASNVTYGTADVALESRNYSTTSGNVVSGGRLGFGTTTVNAKVSAALWISGTNSGVFGNDLGYLWIESL